MTDPTGRKWGEPSRWGTPSTQNQDAKQLTVWSKEKEEKKGTKWGQLAVPQSSSGPIKTHEIKPLSQNYIGEAGSGRGALSMQRHQEEMRVVENALDKMVFQVDANLGKINQVIQTFISNTDTANKQVVTYIKDIMRRAQSNDPSFGPDELDKAKQILEFSKVANELMLSSSNAALDMVAKGGTIVTQQVHDVLTVIFDARTKQVALFAEKVKVFQAQEKHDLEVMLTIQKAKLEEQSQFFQQMKEVAQFKREEKEQHFKQKMEVKKLDLEAQWKRMEMQIKQQEADNAKEIKEAELVLHGKIESQRIAADTAVKQKAIDADAETQRTGLRLNHTRDMHKINTDRDVAVTSKFIDAATPKPCLIS